MSHFAVMVVGDVEYNLAPFHEFECTGRNDEFVVNVDQLGEAREAYAKEKTRRYRDPEGNLHEPWDDQFYRDPTAEEADKIGLGGSGFGGGLSWHSKDWGDGQGYRAKVHFQPEGWEEVEVPVMEIQTFTEYVREQYGRAELEPFEAPDLEGAHKYGWCRINEAGEVIELIDRTNPNKKWDWYQIGGRWSGFLKLKDGATGGMGKRSWTNREDDQRAGWVDSARKGDIDVAGMRDEEGTKAAERWDQACADRRAAGVALDTWMPWKECFEAHEKKHDAAREAYWEQPAVKAMRAAVQARGDFVWGDMDDLMTPRDQYIQRARDGAIVTFALCHDRRWAQRGEMGWWACVSGEKDKDDWNAEFSTYFDSLPDDALITVVDCHI